MGQTQQAGRHFTVELPEQTRRIPQGGGLQRLLDPRKVRISLRRTLGDQCDSLTELCADTRRSVFPVVFFTVAAAASAFAQN